MMEQYELITLKEAAQALRVHPNTLRNWDNEGKLKAVRIGTRGDRRYPASVIKRMAEVVDLKEKYF